MMEPSLPSAILIMRAISDTFKQFVIRVRQQILRRVNVSSYGRLLRQWLCAVNIKRLFSINGGTSTDLVGPSSPSILHALIIGIDEYKSGRITNLCGAVFDADSMDEYLRTELRVPKHQIVNLRNHNATRNAILRELQALQSHETIRAGDPILIYFAGYGATTKAPRGWSRWTTGSQNVSLIMPYDCLASANDGRCIYPIPDRTISGILYELSKQKGTNDGFGNITVIFDCCHVASGTRPPGRTTPFRLVRGFEFEADELLPSQLDEPVWKRAQDHCAVAVAPGFLHSGCKSHIVLAACCESEFAQEVEQRGLFTRALLETLRNVPIDRISYLDLMQCIPNIPGQTPQCAGHHRRRILFNALVRSKPRAVYQATQVGDQLFIDAGFTHGVAHDTEFAIYLHRNIAASDVPLAVMKPEMVHAFRAVLANATFLPNRFLQNSHDNCSYFARQVSLGKVETLRLHIAPQESEGLLLVRQALERISQPLSGGPVITLADEEVHSDLSLRACGGDVQYIITESLIASCGLANLSQTTKAEVRSIHRVLSSAAHFFRVLHYSPQQRDLRDLIHLQVHALVQDEDAELGPDLRRPWTTCGDNLYESGFIDVVADDDTPYGIAIRNNSNLPLHVWAFYLDCSKLAISEYYKPLAIRHGSEPSLPAQSTLTIGYGAGGGLPYTFFLREDQDVDVGFIKLFMTTEGIDLSGIERSSPFKRPASRSRSNQTDKMDGVWDSFMITIVQRKPGSDCGPADDSTVF